MKKVVVMGGGHGCSCILEGFKKIDNIELTAIVTVADDGGSTGRLRAQYHIPAMGDIRNVMVALAENESLLGPLMDYRFSGESDVGGHSLGNLMLTALTQTTGDFMLAIQKLSKVLNVRGTIIPSTNQVVTLLAMMEDGTLVRGESNIPKVMNHIQRVFYQEEVHANELAIKAIEEADYIIYGIGSLYTSILPNIIIPEIKEAIKQSNALKIYYCNAMTQPGETDHYSMEDHVEAILKHAGARIVDTVIMHNDTLDPVILERYKDEGSAEVYVREKQHDYEMRYRSLLKFDDQLIRHDSEKVTKAFLEILDEE